MSVDDLVVVAGAGGFIGGHFIRHLMVKGYTHIRAIDIKPFDQWFQLGLGIENFERDLRIERNCIEAVRGAKEVYNFAADMGGMGFIERYRIACMRSVLINTHLIEASHKAGVEKYLFSSSACVYNTNLQKDTNNCGLKESDAYPAMAERGYGWEKLYSEMLCQEYWAERGLKTYLPRYHNVYGEHGTWEGGREKAPAAICRKVIEAIDTGSGRIDIWGDGQQTRSFQYISDAVEGIDRIMHCDNLIATPINLGSSEMVSINGLVDIVEEIAGVSLERHYDPDAPKGVRGRSSDNTFIHDVLGWEPSVSLREGMYRTYGWIKQEYFKRKNR